MINKKLHWNLQSRTNYNKMFISVFLWKSFIPPPSTWEWLCPCWKANIPIKCWVFSVFFFFFYKILTSSPSVRMIMSMMEGKYTNKMFIFALLQKSLPPPPPWEWLCPCWKANIPIRLTRNPPTEIINNLSCFTSGGSAKR